MFLVNAERVMIKNTSIMRGAIFREIMSDSEQIVKFIDK